MYWKFSKIDKFWWFEFSVSSIRKAVGKWFFKCLTIFKFASCNKLFNSHFYSCWDNTLKVLHFLNRMWGKHTTNVATKPKHPKIIWLLWDFKMLMQTFLLPFTSGVWQTCSVFKMVTQKLTIWNMYSVYLVEQIERI